MTWMWTLALMLLITSKLWFRYWKDNQRDDETEFNVSVTNVVPLPTRNPSRSLKWRCENSKMCSRRSRMRWSTLSEGSKRCGIRTVSVWCGYCLAFLFFYTFQAAACLVLMCILFCFRIHQCKGQKLCHFCLDRPRWLGCLAGESGRNFTSHDSSKQN